MVLVLTEQDVERLLSIDDAIASVEAAFRAHATGSTVMPKRLQVLVPGMKGDLRIMPAAIPSEGVVGFKSISGAAGMRDPASTYFTVALFDPADGKLLAVMGANYLTQLRTGAASAIATKYLARREAETIGVFGTGVQASAQLAAVAKVRRIRKGWAYDIIPDRSRTFCQRMMDRVGVELMPSERPEDAAQADIIITSTTSNKPFLSGDWVKPGTHVNAMGANSPSKQELDISLLKRSKIVVDMKEQALSEAGDLIAPISKGLISSESIYAELADLVSGRKPGRVDDTEVTVFKSVGVAIEDVAIAKISYQRAVEAHVGRELTL